jgi:hypothetical protein
VKRKKKAGKKATAPRRSGRIMIGDSKLVYSPARGTMDLERAVLALAGWRAGRALQTAENLLQTVLHEANPSDLFQEPWEQEHVGRFPLTDDLPLPVTPLAPCDGTSCSLLQSRILAPAEFNACCGDALNKADVNWSAVAVLLRACADAATDGPLHVTVDHQGGRVYYGDHLRELFPDGFVWHLGEAPHESLYHVQHNGRELTVRFRVDADAESLCTAAASMLSKYLRELMMARLNGFFQAHLPELRPTAGYYGDGRRFIDETAELRQKLGVRDERFIRVR